MPKYGLLLINFAFAVYAVRGKAVGLEPYPLTTVGAVGRARGVMRWQIRFPLRQFFAAMTIEICDRGVIYATRRAEESRLHYFDL